MCELRQKKYKNEPRGYPRSLAGSLADWPRSNSGVGEVEEMGYHRSTAKWMFWGVWMAVGCLAKGAHDDKDNDNNNRTYRVAIGCAEEEVKGESGVDHPRKRERMTHCKNNSTHIVNRSLADIFFRIQWFVIIIRSVLWNVFAQGHFLVRVGAGAVS